MLGGRSLVHDGTGEPGTRWDGEPGTRWDGEPGNRDMHSTLGFSPGSLGLLRQRSLTHWNWQLREAMPQILCQRNWQPRKAVPQILCLAAKKSYALNPLIKKISS